MQCIYRSTTLILVLGKLTRQHLKVIHALISQQENRTLKLYSYIRENLPTMSDKQINNLYCVAYENLDLFIEVGVEELCEFVLGRMGGLKQAERLAKLLWLIEKVDVDNRLRLGFVENLVEQRRRDSQILGNGQDLFIKLKLIYIEMLARNGRQG